MSSSPLPPTNVESNSSSPPSQQISHLDSIRDVLSRAKIDEHELKYEIQHLKFDPFDNDDEKIFPNSDDNFDDNNSEESASEYRFLRIDDEKLMNAIESGEIQELTIRGDETDTTAAVICTHDKTYVLKESETSNTVLIAPQCRFSKELGSDDGNILDEERITEVKVVGIQQKFLDMIREEQPRTEKLRKMLLEHLYVGPQNEAMEQGVNKQKYRLVDFLEHIPSSEQEILDAISKMRVVLIDGFYRQLDFDYLIRIYTLITQCLDENGWSWKKFDKYRLIDSIAKESGEPDIVLDAFLLWFGARIPVQGGGSMAIDEDEANGDRLVIDSEPIVGKMEEHWKLDEKAVCRLCAEMLLKPVGKFNTTDFFDLWTRSVPYGMAEFAVDQQLSGLALIRRDCRPEYVQYLPTESLPDEIEQRLTMLFGVKTKWAADELMAYMVMGSGVNSNMGDTLMKYCRVSNGPDGKKWYTSKKIIS